eukprot:1240298-Amphidinium_carterae.1
MTRVTYLVIILVWTVPVLCCKDQGSLRSSACWAPFLNREVSTAAQQACWQSSVLRHAFCNLTMSGSLD